MRTFGGAKNKGWIKNLNTGQLQHFQFNPPDFTIDRSATYSEIVSPGMNYPVLQYCHGDSRSFSVELFLYDKPTFTGTIPVYEDFFSSFLPPEENQLFYKKPAEMLFCYGKFIRRCVLTGFTSKHEECDEYGNPIQSTETLKLKQVGK